jgi:hypothetical protein
MESSAMDEKNPAFQEKYRKLYDALDKLAPQGLNARGGIFTKKKRQQLLGLKGQSGRDRKKYDFWYDTRQFVKAALVDIQLFIETATLEDLEKTLNRKTLEPLVSVFLSDSAESSSEKARVAQLLIETGFGYLRGKNQDFVRPPQEQAINNAIDLSHQLTALLLPDAERKQYLLDTRDINVFK